MPLARGLPPVGGKWDSHPSMGGDNKLGRRGPGLAPVAAARARDASFLLDAGDFGDFGVSFAATVAGRYTRRGGPRLSVQGEPLIVLTRGP